MEVCRRIIKEGLSVREVERLVATLSRRAGKRRTGTEKPIEIRNLEEELKRVLGTKVEITMGRKRGRIAIEFYSLEELDRILELLRG